MSKTRKAGARVSCTKNKLGKNLKIQLSENKVRGLGWDRSSILVTESIGKRGNNVVLLLTPSVLKRGCQLTRAQTKAKRFEVRVEAPSNVAEFPMQKAIASFNKLGIELELPLKSARKMPENAQLDLFNSITTGGLS